MISNQKNLRATTNRGMPKRRRSHQMMANFPTSPKLVMQRWPPRSGDLPRRTMLLNTCTKRKSRLKRNPSKRRRVRLYYPITRQLSMRCMRVLMRKILRRIPKKFKKRRRLKRPSQRRSQSKSRKRRSRLRRRKKCQLPLLILERMKP